MNRIKRELKKLLALVLTAALMLSCVPVAGIAETGVREDGALTVLGFCPETWEEARTSSSSAAGRSALKPRELRLRP